jgi:hypothetical protein
MELVQTYVDGHPWLGRFKAQQFSTSQRQVATKSKCCHSKNKTSLLQFLHFSTLLTTNGISVFEISWHMQTTPQVPPSQSDDMWSLLKEDISTNVRQMPVTVSELYFPAETLNIDAVFMFWSSTLRFTVLRKSIASCCLSQMQYPRSHSYTSASHCRDPGFEAVADNLVFVMRKAVASVWWTLQQLVSSAVVSLNLHNE